MTFNIVNSKQILLFLALSCLVTKASSTRFRGQYNEKPQDQKRRRAKMDMDMEKDDRDDRDDRNIYGNDGRTDRTISIYGCQTVEELNRSGKTFFPPPEDRDGEFITNNVVATYDSCGDCSGCCRLYSWLLCDEDNDLPYIPCLCNANDNLSLNIPIDGVDRTVAGGGAVNVYGASQNNNGGTFTVISGSQSIDGGSSGATITVSGQNTNGGVPDRTINGGGSGATITVSGQTTNGGSFTIINSGTTSNSVSQSNNGATVTVINP